MKTKFLVGMLLAASSVFAAPRVSIGIGLGYPYVAPPPVVVYQPPYPGYGYTWVNGYSYYAGPRRVWHGGYWARPSYSRGYYGRGYRYNSYRHSYYGYYGRYRR